MRWLLLFSSITLICSGAVLLHHFFTPTSRRISDYTIDTTMPIRLTPTGDSSGN